MSLDIESSGEFTGEKKYQGRTDEECAELAKRSYRGEIFCSFDIPEHSQNLISTIFMPLIFMGSLEIKQLQADECFYFFAEMKDAMPRAINGFPMFMSMAILNRKDVERIIAKRNEILKLLDNV